MREEERLSIHVAGTATPAHPGKALAEEMARRGLSAHRLSMKARMPQSRLSLILSGKRAITPETAMRLGVCLGTGADFWAHLQTAHDLAVAEKELGETIAREVEPA